MASGCATAEGKQVLLLRAFGAPLRMTSRHTLTVQDGNTLFLSMELGYLISQLNLERNQFDIALRIFHGFSIDVQAEQRYSERIYSKDLVTIANSKLRLPHPMDVVPTTLYPAPQLLTTNVHMVTVSTADLGGHFSA